MDTWRLLDTGHRSAAENIALDEIILEAVGSGVSPPTIRFLQFSPPAVLVGFHQATDLEVRIDYCRQHGIDINRRITGGGAILFEPGHLGWEVIAPKVFFPEYKQKEKLFHLLCQPLIRMLKSIGIEAQFRPRNDIEVHGKKISGTGGTENDHAFLFQGTLLVELNYDLFVKCLRIPVEKIKNKGIDSIRRRVTTIRDELGHVPDMPEIKNVVRQNFENCLNISLVPGSLTSFESERFTARGMYFSTRKWIDRLTSPSREQPLVKSALKCAGGIIRFTAVYDQRSRQIQSAYFDGDFFSYPRRTINDLESALKNCPVNAQDIRKRIDRIFQKYPGAVPGVESADFQTVVLDAIDKPDLLSRGFTLQESNRIFTVNGSFAEIVQSRIRTLLLPYCAKDAQCRHRYSNYCMQCGQCSVSSAYQVGGQAQLEVVTIVSFNDLMQTLHRMKESGEEAFIGCCCAPFYLKHRVDFESAGLKGILVDIEDTTCYELHREQQAYSGTFTGQTNLNSELLEKVIRAAV